jgi:predicted pyridoxine 5'-phosphate oxidase superfamily flavin-nucleotide-binding protein
MSFFTEKQRDLQDEFDTRNLADRLAAAAVTETLSDDQSAFISQRNMFFLSTVDDYGFPSSSYKGGAVGFVRCVDPKTLVFPSYDGNGMFLSVGNIEAQQKIGMLFIDFETPQRLRVRGSARILREGNEFESYPGANVVVKVDIDCLWQNCPRYVHKMQPVEASPHVPDENGLAKIALWKRIDMVQDVLNEHDRKEAESAGLISGEEYQNHVSRGDPG